MEQLGKFIFDMTRTLNLAVSNLLKLVASAFGSISALAHSWSDVPFVGPTIGSLLIAFVIFIVIDIVRDLL